VDHFQIPILQRGKLIHLLFTAAADGCVASEAEKNPAFSRLTRKSGFDTFS
jgi:hypothetical protein